MASKTMTNAELSILTLVAEAPRHGYEIEQVIQERGMREWTEVGFSSIYYLLKKLERAGLVESRLQEAAHGPARKVYHLTAAGGQVLQASLLQALSLPEPRPSRLLLAIGNLPALPPDQAIAALHQYRGHLAARRDHVRRRREAQQPLPYFVDALFDYSLVLIQAEIDWVEQFVEQIRENTKGE